MSAPMGAEQALDEVEHDYLIEISSVFFVSCLESREFCV